MDENCLRKWQCVWGNPVLMPNCPLGTVYNKFGNCVVKGVGNYEDCKKNGKAPDVVEPVSVCSSSPCKNGGTCNDWQDGKSYSCTCQWGYEGETCERATITDPCASDPCKNGATCNPWADGQSFSCTCPWGYLGARCEEELMQRATLTPCMSFPCKNGGICKNSFDGKSYECICPNKYSGENCQKELSVEERCKNDPSLIIPHPVHCHQYYNCSIKYKKVPMFFEQHLSECNYPFQFSTEANSCRNYTEVQCKGRKEEPEGCGYLKNMCPISSCEPCYIDYPSCKSYVDGLHEHSYKKRPWFMICNKERVVATGLCPYNKDARAQSNPIDGKCATE